MLTFDVGGWPPQSTADFSILEATDKFKGK